MISFKELLSGNLITDLSIAQQHNMEDLLVAVNKLRAAWGKPLRVTSGFRTMQDHLRIYSQKGITDKAKIPMGSKHLSGLAVDFADPDGSLYAWAYANPTLLAEWGIWCEADTKGWLHCQIAPPKSGSRFFKP